LYAVRKLYRDPSRRLVAGVASGIAGHLGVPVYAVRVTFVALLPFDGLGALLYAVFWAVLSSAPGVPPRKRDKRQMLTYLALGLGVLLVQQMIGLGGGSNMFLGWLIAIIAIGAGIIWHLADPDRRRRWTSAVPNAPWLGAVVDESSRRSYLLRIVGGGACVIVGIIGISLVAAPHAGVGFTELLGGLLYALVALAGVALVIAPLLWRTFGQLRAERVGRIREQERAEIAAMVHDQVLHTLALIQRKAGDTKEVVRLARGQERTLRNWLYKPIASPTERFSAAVEEIVAEVEDTYAIVVESVVVGDIDVSERVAALAAAAREALVNAARHAKVASVSLYAEVEADAISVFVRDRGVGFDPAAVGPDRHGVRGSIMGRMERHGGTSEIRSEPGNGTEVRLFMPTPEGRERHG
jgi:signal transduction histidine kinase